MIRPGENVIIDVLVWLRDTLCQDGWYAEHGVAILIENQKDILYEIEKTVSGTTGCVMVLKAPRAENNRPALNISLELMILENPTMNRVKANAATALDVAWHAALALDGPNMMLRTVEHTEVDNLFQARATLDAIVMRDV